jgi:hypothetical protein
MKSVILELLRQSVDCQFVPVQKLFAQHFEPKTQQLHQHRSLLFSLRLIKISEHYYFQ